MSFLLGLIIVLGCVVSGYTLHGGNLGVLWQPTEVLIICGAAVGAFVIAHPNDVKKDTLKNFKNLFKSKAYNKKDYMDLLLMLFTVLKTIKVRGMLTLESHLENPKESDIFSKFPLFLHHHHNVEFLCDSLRLLTMGLDTPHVFDDLLEKEIDMHHHEAEAPGGAIGSIAEGMPALGMVAAVLGVIITMGSISEPPEVLGKLIGAALVGTFLGVLLSYGIIGPMGNYLTKFADGETRYLNCIKAAIVAHLQGCAPIVSVEFARKGVPMHDRPSFKELEESINNLNASGGGQNMAGNTKQPIIKKVKKGGHGHHGGAWKVAYADFVTAMMAFFLLLWLLSSASKEQLNAIADYFTPTVGIAGGEGIGFKGGVSSKSEGTEVGEAKDEAIIFGADTEGAIIKLEEDKSESYEEIDAKNFTSLQNDLYKAINDDPELREFRENILISQTPEGLKISLLQKEERPMFEKGTDKLQPYMGELLVKITDFIKFLPNYISITGHTSYDNVKGNYDDWELSASRANSAREYMMKFGSLNDEQVIRILGIADRDPIDRDNPASDKNIRIDIVLLRNNIVPFHKRSLPDSTLQKDSIGGITTND